MAICCTSENYVQKWSTKLHKYRCAVPEGLVMYTEVYEEKQLLQNCPRISSIMKGF